MSITFITALVICKNEFPMNDTESTAELTVQTPMARYREALSRGDLREDTSQAQVMLKFEHLYERLQTSKRAEADNWWQKLRRRAGGGSRTEPVKGLYIWGGVGRGKTCLMDLFYHCLPGERKLRMHFHRFMGMVHSRLNALKGEKNPLQKIGRELAEKADVLCFDEFFVSDIGDAMLLAGLLGSLFEEGVVLVATSNLPPQRLYENGLQRSQFIPAIKLIEVHTEVLNMDGGYDYRLSALEQAELYYWPLDERAGQAMEACFMRLVGAQDWQADVSLDVLGRNLRAKRWAEGLVWFTFAELCEGPRSASDYVELARQYHTVLMSGVPGMDALNDDAARRFVALVDEFYDHSVKLVLSAAVPINGLYQGQHLAFAFERTASRLQEMQSHAYLAREHNP